EAAGRNVTVPAFRPLPIVAADYNATRRIAAALVNAQNPRINVGRLRTPTGVKLAIDLVELVGAQAGSSATVGPMSFPMSHPLRGTGVAGPPVDFMPSLDVAANTRGADEPSHAAGNHQLASASIQGPALLATNFNVGSRRSGINSATDLDIEADA